MHYLSRCNYQLSNKPCDKKHPKGIVFLFLTELWERFSYYGFAALLILYMSKTFHVPEKYVYTIYGAYGALVYTTPAIGGFIADKVFGCYSAVLYGALLITLGHFIMAIPEPTHHYFYLGLAFIIVGTGLFKPSISTMVGQLYENCPELRDNGFTIAYMGSNLGTIIAPIVCAYVAKSFGYHIAFSLAGIGMIVGMLTCYIGKKHFSASSITAPQTSNNVLKLLTALICIAGIYAVFYALNNPKGVGMILDVVGSLTFAVLLTIALRSPKKERNNMLIVIMLTLFYVIFMALLQQSGGAMNLFTDQFVDRKIAGQIIPTGAFQAVEPLAIVLLTPLYTTLWRTLQKHSINLRYEFKFFVALLIMGFSFVIMVLSIHYTPTHLNQNMAWINFSYLLMAAGELFIGPIGLAMLSSLVPKRVIGLFMGAWVLASAFANYIAAKIGMLTSSNSLQHLLRKDALQLYLSAYGYMVVIAFSAALLLLAIIPLLRKAYGNSFAAI